MTILKRLLRFLEQNEVLVILMLLGTVLRWPSLYEPNWYGDEGIYLVLGQALKQGLVWYRDIHDNKPPLLYLLAALAGNVMWFRFITLVANLITIGVIWRLARRLLQRPVLVGLATLLFVLATCLPALEGNVANAEIFMILPVSLAMLVLLGAKNWHAYFVAGLLFAIGFLFKVPAGFDFAASVFWLLFFGGRASKVRLLPGLIGLFFGFTLPVLLTFAYYWLMGAGSEYLNAAFLQNIGYLASWRTGVISRSGVSSQSGLLLRAIILTITLAASWWLTRKESAKTRLLPVWISFALFGALLSERPYPHYLIQIIPPIALVLPSLLKKQATSFRLLIIGLAGLILVAVINFKFYFYPSFKYYANFAGFITGKIPLETYRSSFDWRVNRNYQIAKYIKLHSTRADKIFVWGDEPAIYALSQRLPVGRFTVAYHIIDFGSREDTLATINAEKPLYIVLMESERREFDNLVAFVSANYLTVSTIEDATIYRRLKN